MVFIYAFRMGPVLQILVLWKEKAKKIQKVMVECKKHKQISFSFRAWVRLIGTTDIFG